MSAEGSTFSKEAFPRRRTTESQGYVMSIDYYGIYTKFTFAVAQAGNPKGSLRLKGNGINVSVGNRLFPKNLNRSKELVIELGHKIINKYNIEPDWALLHELGKEVSRPYVTMYI